MKKIHNLLIACGILLAGCSEISDETGGPSAPAPVKYVSLRLQAGADTRAELDDALQVKFRPGDMIDINGEAYEVFLLDDGTAAVPEVPEADRYEAVFPSTYNFLQQTKENANFKLPLAQFYAGPGTFGCNAMPMYGLATGIDEEKGYVNIRLHNLCGVLKLTLKGSATINSILVEDRAGAPISGYATLESDEQGNKILVPGTSSSARSYHLAINCGGAGVKAAFEGKSGRVITLKRVSEDPYMCITEEADVRLIANVEKKVPREWINADGTNVMPQLVHYILPLIQAEITPLWINGLPRHIRLHK